MCDIEPTTITYRVEGMTCGHCVASVTAALAAVDGVTDVAVDLDSGAVTVTAVHQPDGATVRRAVADAGYEVRS